MTERPIIFSAPMVRALLGGRKTMTRRVLKPQPKRFRLTADDPYYGLKRGDLCPVTAFQADDEDCPRVALGRVITRQKIPFAVGDHLWVREACIIGKGVGGYAKDVDPDHHPDGPTIDVIYRADGHSDAGPWRPSIHMPRTVSRITLAVTAVKIERLQDISAEDAIAEGISWSDQYEGYHTEDCRHYHSASPERSFAKLWVALHGDAAWDANPEVVCISFKRVP